MLKYQDDNITQKAFLRHHPQWKDGFDDILKSRWEHGLKSQRTNQMGDWIALSQLGVSLCRWTCCFGKSCGTPETPVHQRRIGLDVHGPVPRTR